MAQTDTTPPGAPNWIELFTSDSARSQDFYGALFGWAAETMGEEYGGYVNFSKDGRRVAGSMTNDGSTGAPDAWSVYLATADAQATADAAVAHGGEVVVPPMPVMDLGTMLVLTDAGRAAVGAWQPGTHLGFEVAGEPGAPNWFELHTRDYDASVAFYRDVFRWDAHAMSDSPEFRYTTLGEGDTARAGIMDASAFLPDGAAAYWRVYFGVDDTDVVAAQVVDLGGSVLRAAEDTPYGRIAEVTDPTGVQFSLLKS
jgi:predicted enzyme related to lactoylglutathione lyase